MKIRSIELREIRLPLREPFRISSGVVEQRRILLIRLENGDGAAAWSECVAGEEPNYSAETVDTAWHAITEWFGPRVLGVAMSHPLEADAVLGAGVRGHRMASAAIEMGIWNVHATRTGVPLARLLGGERTAVDVGISLGIQESPDALVERAVRSVADGYRRVKLKIAPGRDVAWVGAVRSALGPGAPLSVDANSAYTLADPAPLLALDEFGLLMIEQPLEQEDLVRHAVLQVMLRTPICLDESITSVARAEDMLALGSGRIVNIKPGRVGGFGQSLAIHDACMRAGVPVWCGGMLESGIGRGHNIALASLPNFTLPGDLSPSARYWERDVVTPAWTMSAEGTVAVPDGAGIGVTVDEAFIDDLTVRRVLLRAR